METFDSWLDEQIENNWSIAGLGIIVFNHNEILHEKYCGYKNIDKNEYVDHNTKFNIGSCQKSMLNLATMMLIPDEKLIDMYYNVKITRIVKNRIHNDYKNTKVLNLANHTSGVGRQNFDIFNNKKDFLHVTKNLNDMDEITARKTMTKKLLLLKPSTIPNTTFDYSNYGYAILAHVLENYTNKNYETILREQIFDFLNIDSVTFNINDNNNASPHAYNYENDRFNTKLFTFGSEPICLSPSGQLFMTPRDMSKYLQFYLQYKSDEKYQPMIDKIRFTHNEIKYKNTEKEYNFGWISVNNGEFIYHTGGMFGLFCEFHVNFNKNYGYAICTNTTNNPICLNYIGTKIKELLG